MAKKWQGSRHCWHCEKQLQLKKGGGYHYANIRDPLGNVLRVHVGCVKQAIGGGYVEVPATPESEAAAATIEQRPAASGDWKLKRTAQCKKCPWRKDVDPHDIPNGYCETKHRNLSKTIAKPGDLSGLAPGAPLVAMACHETHDAHCVGWVANQLGPGNNIALRFSMRNCSNIGKLRLVGEQHERFEETLPNAGS